jgi:hypothetical protein
MNRPRLSQAATRLLRAILDRAGEDRCRILLSIFSSTDWQSLTFVGERHEFELVFTGPNPERLFHAISDGLAEAEIALPGHLLADIAVRGDPVRRPDGALVVTIEALTVAD